MNRQAEIRTRAAEPIVRFNKRRFPQAHIHGAEVRAGRWYLRTPFGQYTQAEMIRRFGEVK